MGASPDRASALRLVTAVALHVTAIWTDRRHLDVSLLASEVAVELECLRVDAPGRISDENAWAYARKEPAS